MRLKIQKTVKSFEDYKSLEEVKMQFEAYAPSELARHLRLYSDMFLEAYVIETNPDFNYGKTASVYVKCITRDGIQVLNEVSACSVLHNGDMIEVEAKDGYLTTNGESYPKTKESRILIKEKGVMVF